MFLHNVIHDKAEVKKPWYEFRHEGNSLFIWRLIFGFICFAMIIGFLIFSFIMIRNMIYGDVSTSAKVFMILGLILQFLFLMIIISYISLFLNDFVVPLMFKHRISATRGWTLFLRLLNQHPGQFFVYGLYVFVLVLLMILCVLLFGIFTCCIGFLLLIIPYIGSVVFLPVSYTFRAFSIEFLEQFGEEYKFFPVDGDEDNVVVNT
nr:hypothetical protein [Bacteroidota bacterium]